jgi:hypothetical protein
MTRAQLATLLTAIVAASTGATAPGCAPCPYTETVRTFTVTVDAAQACALADDAFGLREIAPTISAAACAVACKDATVNACDLDQAYLTAYFAPDPGTGGAGGGGAGGAGGGGGSANASCPAKPTTATLTCNVTESHGSYHDGCPIAGRRPAGLAAAAPGADTAGDFLARCAALEAAAVIAFERVALELVELRAPAALVADVRAAAADEVRHTQTMTRLARARGAAARPPVVAPREPRSIEAMAVENAVEGIVRETFGAAVALHQSGQAKDADVRAALLTIAGEECGHAALSFRVGAFLEGRLDAAARARVEAARRQAIADLRRECEEEPPGYAAELGLPDRAVARRLLAGVEADLWSAPLAA